MAVRVSQSLCPLDFAPAFGRAVRRFAAGLETGLKPRATWKRIALCAIVPIQAMSPHPF